MCTVFAHALLGLTAAVAVEPWLLGGAAGREPASANGGSLLRLRRRARWLAAACAALPDLDTGLHFYGVSYDSVWGHRGVMHSFLFAAIVGVVVSALAFQSLGPWRVGRGVGRRVAMAALIACVTASHGVLDMFTDGGNGIALFAPFSEERYFAPWNPFPVPMMGLANLFTAYMVEVLTAETLWIGVPCVVLLAIFWWTRRRPTPIACG